MKTSNIKKYNSKGFTLVEMMVAVLIMSIAVVGMIVVSSSGIVNFRYLKDKMNAGYLAGEGIELAHNFRDSYIISPDSGGWDGFVSATSGCEDGCTMDALYPGIVNSCAVTPDGPCQNIKVLNGVYTYGATGAQDTKFIRVIKIIPITEGGNDEVLVESTVLWREGTKKYTVTSTGSLMNWLDAAPVL